MPMPEPRPAYHKHPDSGVPLYGILLKPGMRLWSSDLHASISGDWEPNPFPPGVLLLENDDKRWVRPVPEGVTSSLEYVPGNYRHPKSSAQIIGTAILPGTLLHPGDVYSDPNGKWESCPCPGVVLESISGGVIWIRPDDVPR